MLCGRTYNIVFWVRQLNRKDNRQVKLYLSSLCRERLWRYITQKYPTGTYGQLSAVVEGFINRCIVKDEVQGHTHPSTSQMTNPISENSQNETDELLILKAKVVRLLGMEFEERYDKEFPRQEVQDAIKLVLRITDDRPARARLRLMIRRGLCVELNPIKGHTKRIKFKSAFDDTEASTMEAKKKEVDAVVAKYQAECD
jgi:hypothetical protein